MDITIFICLLMLLQAIKPSIVRQRILMKIWRQHGAFN